MRYMVCAPVCGLGNRLQALFSCVAIADMIGVPLKVWWESCSSCQCVFTDLFEPTLERFSLTDMDVGRYIKDEKLGVKIQDTILIKNNNIIRDEDTNADILILGANQPIKFPGETTAAIYGRLKYGLKQLKIKEGIQLELDQFNLAECLGVHVGRGQVAAKALLGSKNDIARCIPLQMYFDKIDELNPAEIFISCEDEADENAFLAKYGDKVKVRRGEKSRGTTGGMVEAFINMMLLSKCSQILDGKSSFSRVAAYCGGIPVIELKNTDGILPESHGDTRCEN